MSGQLGMACPECGAPTEVARHVFVAARSTRPHALELSCTACAWHGLVRPDEGIDLFQQRGALWEPPSGGAWTGAGDATDFVTAPVARAVWLVEVETGNSHAVTTFPREHPAARRSDPSDGDALGRVGPGWARARRAVTGPRLNPLCLWEADAGTRTPDPFITSDQPLSHQGRPGHSTPPPARLATGPAGHHRRLTPTALGPGRAQQRPGEPERGRRPHRGRGRATRPSNIAGSTVGTVVAAISQPLRFIEHSGVCIYRREDLSAGWPRSPA